MKAIENVKSVEFIYDDLKIGEVRAEDIKEMEFIGLSETLVFKYRRFIPVVYADEIRFKAEIDSDNQIDGKKFNLVRIIYRLSLYDKRDCNGKLHSEEIEIGTQAIEIKLKSKATIEEFDDD